MDDRESNIRQARVYLAQARVTPHHAWKSTLLNWAGKRRRMISEPKPEPQQGDLFA